MIVLVIIGSILFAIVISPVIIIAVSAEDARRMKQIRTEVMKARKGITEDQIVDLKQNLYHLAAKMFDEKKRTEARDLIGTL